MQGSSEERGGRGAGPVVTTRYGPSMIRHVAVFRWHEGTTPEQVDAVRAGLDRMPVEVPSVRAYAHGPDLHLGEGRWDYAVVADFDDAAGYQAYVDHPAHDEFRRAALAPVIADRGHVQIDLGPVAAH